MVMRIVQAQGEMDVLYPNGYSYEDFAEHILSKIEEAGMKPPCLSGEKCQWLLKTYIDPVFTYWDEDFDKEKEEYELKETKKDS